MAIAELTLVPLGTGTTSVSPYVAGALDVLADYPNVKYALNPMGTVLEGEPDDLFAVVKAMRESVFDKGAERCYFVLKWDERKDKAASMEQKLASVAEKRKN